MNLMQSCLSLSGISNKKYCFNTSTTDVKRSVKIFKKCDPGHTYCVNNKSYSNKSTQTFGFMGHKSQSPAWKSCIKHPPCMDVVAMKANLYLLLS